MTPIDKYIVEKFTKRLIMLEYPVFRLLTDTIIDIVKQYRENDGRDIYFSTIPIKKYASEYIREDLPKIELEQRAYNDMGEAYFELIPINALCDVGGQKMMQVLDHRHIYDGKLCFAYASEVVAFFARTTA